MKWEEPAEARKLQEKLGGTTRKWEEPAETRKLQEKLGGTRRN